MAPNAAAAKRVGILGTGNVGQTLGLGFVRHGYDVKLGSRDAHNPKLAGWLTKTQGHASVGTFADAARFADLVVLAVHGAAVEKALEAAGTDAFAGKLVIDATNPLQERSGAPPGLFTGNHDSLGERIQRKLANARVVKCFNTISHSKMIDPKFQAPAPMMMIAGNDAAAKAEVDALLRQLGWPGALDVGDIEAARYLEALVPLWVRVGMKLNTWGHGFHVVT